MGQGGASSSYSNDSGMFTRLGQVEIEQGRAHVLQASVHVVTHIDQNDVNLLIKSGKRSGLPPHRKLGSESFTLPLDISISFECFTSSVCCAICVVHSETNRPETRMVFN